MTVGLVITQLGSSGQPTIVGHLIQVTLRLTLGRGVTHCRGQKPTTVGLVMTQRGSP